MFCGVHFSFGQGREGGRESFGGLGQSLQRTFQEVESGSNHGEECSEVLALLWPSFSLLNGGVCCCFPVLGSSLVLVSWR